jgi:hypothetical protein
MKLTTSMRLPKFYVNFISVPRPAFFGPKTASGPRRGFKRETTLVLPELDKQKDVDPLDLLAAIVSKRPSDIFATVRFAGIGC